MSREDPYREFDRQLGTRNLLPPWSYWRLLAPQAHAVRLFLYAAAAVFVMCAFGLMLALMQGGPGLVLQILLAGLIVVVGGVAVIGLAAAAFVVVTEGLVMVVRAPVRAVGALRRRR